MKLSVSRVAEQQLHAGKKAITVVMCSKGVSPDFAQMPAAAGPGGASHKDAQAVHQLLKGGLGDEAAAERWRQQCAAVFRWSRYFGGADCVALEAEAAVDTGAANGVAGKVAALAI